MSAVIDSEMRRLWERDGFLTPVQVLREATDPESPMHNRFDWDDSSAAEKWRIEQARGLIRSCKTTIEVKPDSFVRVRSYVAVPDTYMPVSDALSNAPTRDLVMQQALRDIRVLRMKYSALIDFSEALKVSLAASAPDVAA